MRMIHQKVEIYSMTDVMLANGSLVDIDDDHMEIVGEYFPHFERGENLKVCVYDNFQGICWYLTSVNDATMLRLILTDFNLLDVIQRRKSIKIKTTFNTLIHAVYSIDNERIELESPVEITAKDLSVGGVYFISERLFLEGTGVEFLFNRVEPNLRIKTRILRKQELSGDKWGYGCQFWDVTPREADIVFAFLWEEHRRQLKRLKEG